MIRFFTFRLAQTILVLYIIATCVFFLMKAVPGGPFSQERNVSELILKNLEQQYGLNDPIHLQYFKYLKNITPKKIDLRGIISFDLKAGLGIDLGHSFRYEGRSVNELIKTSFPVSLELGIYALLFSSIIGITTGTIAAYKYGTKWDYISMTTVMTAICIPTFVLGPLLSLIFGFLLPERLSLPVMLWENPNSGNWLYNLPYKILPTLTLGSYYAAAIARLTRGSMLEVLAQDFIRTARAKGLSESVILIKHGLRSGLIPVIAYLGPVGAHLITGSFIVEFIYMLPGLGRNLVNAALNRDYTMIMGTVLLYATILMFFNFLVDLAVVMLNPKLQLSPKS